MEYQRLIHIKVSRKIQKESIPVEGEAIINRGDMKGWLRFPEYIGRASGFKIFGLIPDNSRFMVVDDRDSYPVSPYRPDKQKREKQCTASGDEEMADRQADYQLEKDNTEAKKHWYYDSMALAIMACVFIALVMIALFVSGKIDFGGIR